MIKLQKLKVGDKVAVLSPSFAAPGKFPYVYELGLERIREIFGLQPVEYPTTRKLEAGTQERAHDLIAAFKNPEIKAVIASIGGDDQVTYVPHLPANPFIRNPKPFFGYSDNSHLCNFLFLNNIPSFYGACLMTQFAMQKEMDKYTVSYMWQALFGHSELELTTSAEFNEIGLDWGDKTLLETRRVYEKNHGWVWNVPHDAEGVLWGGCLESVDDMLRNNVPIPKLEQFERIVLLLETSEEIPSHHYVRRVVRALGERGILRRVQGVLIGRPKAWEFDKPFSPEVRNEYRKEQRRTIEEFVRLYNPRVPIIQNMDFGHTDPQIPMPYGGMIRISATKKKIFATF